MATIKFSSIVSDVRGKIGGVVFQRNANGAVVRTLTKPSNRNTVQQQNQRGNMAFYSRKWRNLTDEEKQSWTDVTSQYPQQNRVGDTVFLTGFQLYLKVNLNLELAALA